MLSDLMLTPIRCLRLSLPARTITFYTWKNIVENDTMKMVSFPNVSQCVYEIVGVCGKSLYIGQTRRHLERRVKEHLRMKDGKDVHSCGPQCVCKQIFYYVLQEESNQRKRLRFEREEIRQLQPINNIPHKHSKHNG
uniref:GIY-YIG domain-containing protein n=1 Tax=Parascaris univalens TaxID=6257 RepID=A0A915B9Q8_PARUN